jgi:hypothetical protein
MRKLWDYVCDKCSTSIDVRHSPTKENDLLILEDAGWKRVQAKKRILDLCPECAETMGS